MLVTGILTMISGSFAIGNPVSAHTGFESSTPADGAITGEPVTEVLITFTAAATPVGDGFVVLDPTGQSRTPSSVSVAEDRIFTLTFDPPLAGGTIGLRWSVQAPDAHPIEGSFSFDAPSPARVKQQKDKGSVVSESVTSTIPAPVAPAEVGAVDLEEFLTTDDSRPGESTARLGRTLGLVSLVLVIGLLAFLATAMIGRLDELRAGFMAVRVLGAVLAVGAVIEYVGVTRIAGAGLGDMWAMSAGFSTMLRLIGGVILVMGFVPAIETVRAAPRALSAAVLERPVRTVSHTDFIADQHSRGSSLSAQVDKRVRWIPDRGSWTIGPAVTAMLASFWFDGHTVSKGPRLFHALFNTVHVAAGSVWVGGVIAMAIVLWRRRMAGEPGRPHELVVRFSGIATVALGAVTVAGVVMAVFVLDSVGEITGTLWGRVLVLKTVAVALAVCGGAYNHFKLLPSLDAAPDDLEVEAEVRSAVTAEAILLIFVVIVTASLVVAAS